ncbi:MAG: spore maturation protein [Clostridia bacterium]|nr:spore maturation protein [Clostridia bacterium]
MSNYLLPVFILLTLIYAKTKKVNVYNSFTNGAKQSIGLVVSIFPFLATIMIMVQFIKISGLANTLAQFVSPIFNAIGIPSELSELVLLKPFSGNGSLAILNDLYSTYGVDSYIGRSASVIVGSCDTVFYVTTLYCSQTKVKKLLYAIPVALIATLAGSIISCLLCKII